MNIKINKKDDIILKILYYFITEEDYKPVIINGINNEIWLENMEQDLKLIRINTNYIHNDEQLKNDMYKAKTIMKSIKRSTLSLNINMLNLLLDMGDSVNTKSEILNNKNIETINVKKISDFKKNRVICELFPKVKDAVLNEKMDPIEFFKLTDDMNQKTIRNEKKLAKIFSPKKPVVTYLLIVLNLMVFLYMLLYDHNGNITASLSNNSYLMVNNCEYYRLFTSMFLHSGIFHLFFNMLALYQIGPVVERYYGSTKYLLIYIVSGIVGSLFSCIFMNESTYGLGASGAIFGLLGSALYFSYYYRATMQDILKNQLIPVVLLNICIGFIIPEISVSAHIGGLLGGLFISMGLGLGDKNRTNDQINGIIVLLLLIAFMIYMVVVK